MKKRLRIKRLENEYLALMDRYAEVAAALGFDGDEWFGDPLASHEEIVARAELAWSYKRRAEKFF